jgi:hypothetical protein
MTKNEAIELAVLYLTCEGERIELEDFETVRDINSAREVIGNYDEIQEAIELLGRLKEPEETVCQQ